MKEIIRTVNDQLKGIVNYRFQKWKGKAEYPYFIGTLQEDGGGDESGESEYYFLLTGFYRGEDDMFLYDAAEKIKEIFPKDIGSLFRCKSSSLLIAWDSILPDLPDTDTELTKIQITLKVKRWKGKG